jgi:hypothetical protein
MMLYEWANPTAAGRRWKGQAQNAETENNASNRTLQQRNRKSWPIDTVVVQVGT